MASKPEAEAMQELASMLWSRFLKERVREELNHELNAYKAEVVSNNGNGTLTVRRPFESVTPTLKAAPSLAYAQPGDMVMVAGIGDKSKALSNAFVLAKADLSDDTSVPVYGQGENLLDNWYFIGGGSQQGGSQFPINQRLQTSYSNGYGIDRWIVRTANMTMAVEANGLKLSYSSGSYTDFYQLMGSNRLENLAGKTVTFSILDNNGIHAKTFVWDSSGSGSNKGYIANNIQLYAGGTTRSYTNLVLRVYINNYSLMAVKLELGDKQTLAHKENGTWVLNEIPDYEEELVSCMTSTEDPADIYANKVISTNVSKPNLLRNWYFFGGGTGKGVFPVNQRGLTTYSGANQYTIDGWRATNVNTTVTLNASGMVTSAVSGSSAYVVQYLDNQDYLLGKTVTLSVLTSTGLRHATVKLPSTRPSAITVYANIANIGQIIWLSGFWCVRFTSAANGGNTYIAAKLEIGTEQTLAHQENGVWVLNELPDYEEELVKCQTSSVDNTDTYAQKSLATEQQIAYVENGLTASRAYAKGEYFCWNGLLYRATAAISNGQTFTAQNCAQVPEGGFNHLKPLDISTAITAFSNRLTNVTVKAWFYPSNRKIELSAYGEAATTLSATQNTLFTTSTAYAPSGMTFAGCAVKKQTDIVAVWANSTLINVQHGGLAQGDSISVNLSWYI